MRLVVSASTYSPCERPSNSHEGPLRGGCGHRSPETSLYPLLTSSGPGGANSHSGGVGSGRCCAPAEGLQVGPDGNFIEEWWLPATPEQKGFQDFLVAGGKRALTYKGRAQLPGRTEGSVSRVSHAFPESSVYFQQNALET